MGEALFSHPKEELPVVEQPFPHDRCSLRCEQQGFQVIRDDRNLTFPRWNKCWYVIKIKCPSWAEHTQHLSSDKEISFEWECLSCFAGVSMNVQPMYFGESAPKHLRGAISLSSAVFTAFGVVLGQVVGLRYAGVHFSKQADLVKARTMFMLLRCLLTERSWAASSVGSISSPVTPSLASSSSPPCRGSRRAPDTCSSTAGTKRLVFMVPPVKCQ